MSMIAAVASTSGRPQVGSELGFTAAPLCGGRRLQTASRRPAAQQRLRAAAPVLAAFGGKKAYNKYKSRQDLEQDYYKDWEQTTVLAEEDTRKLSALTLLSFLPNFLRFYVVPGPVRFIWYFARSLVLVVAYKLRKVAVLAAVKLDMATMRRRGSAADYHMRTTALRRLHGKESLLAPISLMFGR